MLTQSPFRRLLLAGVMIATAAVGSACGTRDGSPTASSSTAILGAVEELPSPAPAGSKTPVVIADDSGAAYLSWTEQRVDSSFAIRLAKWNGTTWDSSRTVAADLPFFVNWADFPSVVPLSSRTWAAHWLEQRPGNVYAYDVRIALSDDAGTTWSAPFSPHDDGTPTEHGFVSIFADERANVRAVWLDGRHTSGEHEHGNHEAEANGGAMMLRGAVIDDRGQLVGQDVEIDAGVCDCCQTAAACA